MEVGEKFVSFFIYPGKGKVPKFRAVLDLSTQYLHQSLKATHPDFHPALEANLRGLPNDLKVLEKDFWGDEGSPYFSWICWPEESVVGVEVQCAETDRAPKGVHAALKKRWVIRLNLRNHGLARLIHGAVTAALAELTQGTIASSDPFWGESPMPCPAAPFLEWFFSPGKASSQELARWIRKGLEMISDVAQPPAPLKMSEEDFWRLIDQCRKAGRGDRKKQVRLLVSRMAKRSVDEIHEFHDHLLHAQDRCSGAPFGEIAGELMGFVSDDGFEYFQGWLISLGKEVFEAAVKDPAVLRRYKESAGGRGASFFECEEMLTISQEAYESKTGKDWYEEGR